jgi:putative hydrolase
MPNPFGFVPGDDAQGDMGEFFENLGRMMRSGGTQNSGPVDWDAVKNSSSAILEDAGDSSVAPEFIEQAIAATDLADIWLNEATSLPSGGEKCAVITRGQWIQETLIAWQSLVDPVAQGLSQAMSSIIPQDIEAGSIDIPDQLLEQLPPEVAQQMKDLIGSGDFSKMLAPLMAMTKSMGATLFGNQFGHGLGAMATEVLSATDVGIPLTSSRRPTFLATNVTNFSDGLSLEVSDTLIYLALRELAHQRLFAAAPWLRSHIQSSMSEYASGVEVDTGAIEEALSHVDPTNIDEINDALGGDLFVESRTPEQEAALARLELLIALIESWVTVVVTNAVGNRLPSSNALGETLRRRRAAGGPAEKFFVGLVGLEIRPRKIREAAIVWQELTDKIGAHDRDNLWTHPDLLPTTTDLEDVENFIANHSHDLMSDLQKVIDQEGQQSQTQDD